MLPQRHERELDEIGSLSDTGLVGGVQNVENVPPGIYCTVAALGAIGNPLGVHAQPYSHAANKHGVPGGRKNPKCAQRTRRAQRQSMLRATMRIITGRQVRRERRVVLRFLQENYEMIRDDHAVLSTWTTS